LGGLSVLRHAGAVLVLAALVAASYGGTIGHGFVFDDWHLVVENPVVRWPLARAPELLDFGAGGISYRPLRMLSYMVDYRVGGLEPAAFHASNLTYHLAATLALYALAFATIGSLGGALFAAALFAVHPLGSEAVAYVSGRRDLLLALFSLLALLCWWGTLDAAASMPKRIATSLLASLFAALALAAKENAAVVPLLGALLVVVRRRRDGIATSVGRAGGIALVLATVVLVIVARELYLERIYEAFERLGGAALAPQPALTLQVLARYGGLAVWPIDLRADYRPPGWPLPESPFDASSVVAALGLAAVVAGGVWLAWRGHIAGAGLLWFVAALLPVAQIVPYGEIVAEHNAYLPLAGLSLAAGEGADALARRRPRFAIAVCAIIVVLLGVRAHARSSDWSDDETLWAATIESVPRSARARQNLGVSLARRGRLEAARGALEDSLELAPREVEVMHALATISGRLGETERAQRLARRAVQVRKDAGTLTFLGWVYLAEGSPRAAEKTFRAALRLDRKNREARRGLEEIRFRYRSAPGMGGGRG